MSCPSSKDIAKLSAIFKHAYPIFHEELIIKFKKVLKGFGLIEVLIALTIIGVGALGYVTTQVGSLKSVSTTMARTLGTLLIQDMTARIQANAAEFWAGASSGYLSAPSNQQDCYSTSSAGAICTSSQMAQNDLWEWQKLVASAFPAAMQAVGLVCLESPSGTANLSSQACGSVNATYPFVFTIKIYWRSTPGGAYDQAQVATVQAPLLNIPSYPYPNNSAAPNN